MKKKVAKLKKLWNSPLIFVVVPLKINEKNVAFLSEFDNFKNYLCICHQIINLGGQILLFSSYLSTILFDTGNAIL